MAAARDQAARIIRSEPDVDESELAHAAPDEQLRASPPDEPAARAISPMLAPSKPISRNNLRAPSRICRRFELSSSATRESVARVDAAICSASSKKAPGPKRFGRGRYLWFISVNIA